MSWYEEAANEVGAAILAKDGPIVGPREVAAIIAKHDPNKWIPMSELHPVSTGSAERRVHLVASRENRIVESEMLAKFVNPAGWDFWREIVLPEVKG